MNQGDTPHPDPATGNDDWQPTPHGALLARALRECDLVRDASVLELGGGVGNHTTLLIEAGARQVVTTEITAARSATTRRNVEAAHPMFESMEYRVADWLATPGSFDVVLTNPPFAKSGKQNRRYFIDALILDAHKRLPAKGGRLIFVQSSMADLAKSLRRLDENGFDARVVLEDSGPFRDYYFEDATFMAEIEAVPNGYTRDGDTYIETLSVIEARRRPFTPPEGAHLPSGEGAA